MPNKENSSKEHDDIISAMLGSDVAGLDLNKKLELMIGLCIDTNVLQWALSLCYEHGVPFGKSGLCVEELQAYQSTAQDSEGVDGEEWLPDQAELKKIIDKYGGKFRALN